MNVIFDPILGRLRSGDEGGGGGGGSDTLVPLTGTKTATGNIIANQANHTLSFTNTNVFKISGSDTSFTQDNNSPFFDLTVGDITQANQYSNLFVTANAATLYSQGVGVVDYADVHTSATGFIIGQFTQSVIVTGQNNGINLTLNDATQTLSFNATSLTTQFLNTNVFSVQDGSGNFFQRIVASSRSISLGDINGNINGITLDLSDSSFQLGDVGGAVNATINGDPISQLINIGVGGGLGLIRLDGVAQTIIMTAANGVGIGGTPAALFDVNNGAGTSYLLVDPTGHTIDLLMGGAELNMNSTAHVITATVDNVQWYMDSTNNASAYMAMRSGRFEYKNDTITAANNLTLGAANVYTVSGNTQINAITTADWQAGSQVTLIFSGTPTVKNNTAGGAGTAVLLLAASTDFVAAANSVLGLVYDGTSWQETFRKTA